MYSQPAHISFPCSLSHPTQLLSECMWSIVMPLVHQVLDTSTNASKETGQETEVGREHGRSVKLLVHHTRNTAAKQWEETMALTLGGLGKMLRSHMAKLKEIDRFNDLWDDSLHVWCSTGWCDMNWVWVALFVGGT